MGQIEIEILVSTLPSSVVGEIIKDSPKSLWEDVMLNTLRQLDGAMRAQTFNATFF